MPRVRRSLTATIGSVAAVWGTEPEPARPFEPVKVRCSRCVDFERVGVDPEHVREIVAELRVHLLARHGIVPVERRPSRRPGRGRPDTTSDDADPVH